jgi:trehalose utilization protein
MRISNVFLIGFIISIMSFCNTINAQSIHVLVWDEQQPLQSQVYDNFLGNEILNRLKSTSNNFELRSVNLNDSQQGLSNENLDWADVLIWWGHRRHDEISKETAQRKIINRIKAGTLNVIFLHSAHFSTPFMEAMNEVTKEQAYKKYPKSDMKFEFIIPPGRIAPTANSLITPAYYAKQGLGKAPSVRVDLPNCCFPAWRNDGKSSTLHVVAKDHPISKGIPKTMKLMATEMYSAPFHVPEPNEVIFEEKWELGEYFRSGMTWNLAKGKIFYFRPGHETYPIFKKTEIIQIIANACQWLGQD